MGQNPKTWAWGAGILGILLVICGFLSQQKTKPNSKSQCQPSSYTWVTVIVGFLMVLAGFMTLMKMGKGGKSMGAGGELPSISPEPSPDMAGDMGRMA